MSLVLYKESGPNGTPYKKGDWKSFAIHNEKEIKGFFGEYRFLSNFWPAKVFLDDIEYKSVELAYQAAKWEKEDRDYFQKCSELESVDYNRKNIPNSYAKEIWDKNKFEIMENLVTQKFNPDLNPENYKKLLETENKNLEEMNWWEDLYWGTNKNGVGQNMLGKILMEIRKNMVL